MGEGIKKTKQVESSLSWIGSGKISLPTIMEKINPQENEMELLRTSISHFPVNVSNLPVREFRFPNPHLIAPLMI